MVLKAFVFLNAQAERMQTKDVHFVDFLKNVAESLEANRRLPFAFSLQ
jgi:hypothetical protein